MSGSNDSKMLSNDKTSDSPFQVSKRILHWQWPFIHRSAGQGLFLSYVWWEAMNDFIYIFIFTYLLMDLKLFGHSSHSLNAWVCALYTKSHLQIDFGWPFHIINSTSLSHFCNWHQFDFSQLTSDLKCFQRNGSWFTFLRGISVLILLLSVQIQCVLQDVGSNIATPRSSARDSHIRKL